MAQFQIKLLTSILKTKQDIGVSNFLETPISEFYNQTFTKNEEDTTTNITNQKNTFCYTFNEKFSIHKNSQKELTFSMLRNIWLNDGIKLNPFVKNIHPGTIILLIDKYDNEHLFVVKTINYKLNSDNITYDVSCQDLFTYQTIRQNSGYTIDNNYQSVDFIGAKNIDWWAKVKIVPECNISYKYIPLFKGVLQDESNNIHIFATEKEKNLLIQQGIKIKKIIKPIYDEKNYAEYYETFPFSVSGSNASAALIQLGEQLGMSLNICENNIKNDDGSRSNKFLQYFWFEPSKKEEVSNLKYSPKTNIKSFNFSHAGDSLTTVLNIESQEVAEELVSIIPEVPSFFLSLFSSTEWKDKENKYFSGYFSSICKEKILRSKKSLISDFSIADISFKNPQVFDEEQSKYVDTGESFIYFKLKTPNSNNFKIPYFYPKITTAYKDTLSTIYYVGERYTNKTSVFDFVVRVYDDYGDYEEYMFNDSYSVIPFDLLGEELDVYIRVKVNYRETHSVEWIDSENTDLILNFYRDCLDDEIAFAEIADKCPWLENKIIDFSYFLTQKIISKEEYQNLMDIIRNDLRIVNGELLYLSTSYYQALRTRTNQVSDLVNSVDSIGAAFEAEILSPYAEKGTVSDISKFISAYDLFAAKYMYASEKNTILNLNELLTEYSTKYFNSQQRFLKNIYNFKKFFNEKTQWDSGKLYYHKITLIPSEVPTSVSPGEVYFRRFVSFNQNNFLKIDENFNLYDQKTLKPFVTIFEEDKQTFAPIVHQENYKNYFVPLITKDTIKRCNNDGFSYKKTYLRIVYKVEKNKIDLTETCYLNGDYWVLLKEDETYYYYAHAHSEGKYQQNYEDYPSEINSGENVFYKDVVEVDLNEIISEHIYNKYQAKNLNYYWRNSNTKSVVGDNWKTYSEITAEVNKFSLDYWSRMLGYTVNSIDTKAFANFYISEFPVTEFQYKTRVYVNKPFSWVSTWIEDGVEKSKTYKQTYQRANAERKTISDYIEYIKKIKNGEVVEHEVLNPTDYYEEVTYSLVTPLNQSKYYRRVVKNPGWKIAGAAILSSTIPNPVTAAGAGYLISRAMWAAGLTSWNTEGKNGWDINKTSLKSFYEGYHSGLEFEKDTPTIKYIYTSSENSYDNYIKIEKDRRTNEYVFDIEVVDNSTDSNTSSIEKAPSNKKYIVDSITTKNQDDETITTQFVTTVWDKKPIYDSITLFENLSFTYLNLVNLTKTNSNSLGIAIGSERENITYQDAFIRFLTLTDKVNADDKYAIIFQNRGKNKNLVFSDSGLNSMFDSVVDNVVSKNVYYLVLGDAINLNVQKANWTSDKTLEGLLIANGFSRPRLRINNKYFEASYEGEEVSFFVVKLEDYKIESWNDTLNTWLDKESPYGFISRKYRFNFYNGLDIYTTEDQKVNLLELPEITDGFFTRSDGEEDFEKVKEDADFNEDLQYYYSNGTKHERIYTIKQLKKLNKDFYYQNSTQTELYNFSPSAYTSDSLRLYLHEEEYVNEGGMIVLKNRTVIEYTDNVVLNDEELLVDNKNKILQDAEIQFLQPNSNVIEISHQNKTYTTNFNVETSTVEDLEQCTNGYLWVKYHNSELSILQEKALQIETQLTEYWYQAYLASKGCEYFLPEFWQHRGSSTENKFSPDIVFIKWNSNNEIIDVSLLPKFIPNVVVYTDNSEGLTKAYSFEYSKNKPISEDDELKTIDVKNYISGSKFKNHPVFSHIFETILGEDLSNFTFTETGKKTYFYSQTGGMKWSSVIPELSTTNFQFHSLSGNYIMIYKALKAAYKECSFNTYKEKQQQHNNIWSHIYQNFPGIILENTFSNNEATTSEELYVLAKNAFKDMSNPERNYSITLIDNSSLKGYHGQEVLVGDGILLDVEEYYDEYDDVRKTLSQYLFITDISYNLRSDNDIQLTVNTIKYQEKLIQRLVKLIK